ncbi:C-type lectin domain family 2 member F [Apodemus speciosus]|uniref:C-type lectin domain family 2 member F n=1 Tax=Apodemus speciosus TaxID=105296 RepID=A0ABQ0EX15_APOSI
MSASQDEEASMSLIKRDVTTTDHLQQGETDGMASVDRSEAEKNDISSEYGPGTVGSLIKYSKKKNVRIVSPKCPAKLYCCYGAITVLSVAVVALSVVLSARISYGDTWGLLATGSAFTESHQSTPGGGQTTLSITTRMVSIRGDEKYGFLIGNVISSSRDYIPRKCICSKSIDTLWCQ